MSLKTSNLPFKARVDHEVHNTIMRKAVVKAQETIGANRSISEKCEENRKIQIHGDRRNRFKRSA